MNTCLLHVLRKPENIWIVYNFTHTDLCLILSFLCSTANDVTLRHIAMQQIGTVLDTGRKFTENHVSLG